MKGAFEEVFELLSKHAENNLPESRGAAEADIATLSALGKSGSVPFDFPIDDKGNSTYETEQPGFGLTIHAEAEIEAPDATYSLTVKSSGGGGGHWDDVHRKQKIPMKIKTKSFGKTKIKFSLHADVQNQQGRGVFRYKV